jgi:hypothetical protein
VIQTKILIFVMATLMVMIFGIIIVKFKNLQEHSEISDTAELCSAYFQYVDDTHKKIKEVDAMCFRTLDGDTVKSFN